MDNRKIIENIRQTIEKAAQLLQTWQSKPMIDFEEQKAVADLLRQAISDVWAVSSTDIKREKENSHLVKELEIHKESMRKALADLTELLNNLGIPSLLPETPEEKPVQKKTVEKPAEKPFSALKEENRPASIIDTFAVYDENTPALSTPVDSLLKAIGVSDKFLFVRELFNNNAGDFQTAINALDNMKDKEDAQQYLSTLFEQADKNSDAFKQFNALVNRRYMNA
jgi:DNA-binding phage protein